MLYPRHPNTVRCLTGMFLGSSHIPNLSLGGNGCFSGCFFVLFSHGYLQGESPKSFHHSTRWLVWKPLGPLLKVKPFVGPTWKIPRSTQRSCLGIRRSPKMCHEFCWLPQGIRNNPNCLQRSSCIRLEAVRFQHTNDCWKMVVMVVGMVGW